MYTPDLSHAFDDGWTLDEDGRSTVLRVVRLGEINLPTGAIVAADPLVFPDRQPFFRTVSPGTYAVELSIAQFGTDQRVAYAALRLLDAPPQR